MDLARLTTVTRTALIRGGLEQVNLRNLHTWATQVTAANSPGPGRPAGVSREEVVDLLSVSKATARQLLNQLREAGSWCV